MPRRFQPEACGGGAEAWRDTSIPNQVVDETRESTFGTQGIRHVSGREIDVVVGAADVQLSEPQRGRMETRGTPHGGVWGLMYLMRAADRHLDNSQGHWAEM